MSSESQLMPRSVIRTGDYIITSMSFIPVSKSSDGRLSSTTLVTGTDDGYLLVWNLKSQTILDSVKIGDTTLLSVLPISTATDYMVIYTRDQKLVIVKWSPSNKKLQIVKEKLFTDSICPTFCGADMISLVEDSDISYVCVPQDKSVQIHSLSISQCETDISDTGCHVSCSSMVTSLRCVSSDSPDITASLSDSVFCLLVGEEAGIVTMHTIRATDRSCLTSEMMHSLNVLSTNPVLTLDYSLLTLTGIAAGSAGNLSLWKRDNNKLLHYLDIESSAKGYNMIQLRRDSKLFIACAWDGTVRLYSVKKGTLLALLDFHRESVTCITFAADDSFVTASRDRVLCCWDLYADKT